MSTPTSRPATQKDVANLAGVSQAAVSAVFRGHTEKIGVSEATRERIMQAVRSLNYRPNLSARAMRSRRNFSIGLLIGGTERPWKPDGHMCAALHDAASRHEYHLTLVGILGGEDPLPPALRESCLDALLVDGYLDLPPHIAEILNESVVPVIRVLVQQDNNAIYLDEADAARQLTEHLLEHGYKRIDYLSLETPPESRTVKQRLYGYSKVLADKWMHPRHVWPGDADPRQWVVDYLSSLESPQGVVCHNERDAAFLLSAAFRAGVRVPEDLGITAVGIGCVGLLTPLRVTGISFPCVEMADAAIEMADALSNPDDSKNEVEARGFAGIFEQGATTVS